MNAEAEPAPTSEAPLPAVERIAALDVLRGVALFGIFIMNMPGFTHSVFTPPPPDASGLDKLVDALRELLFAGKFNLMFGLLFGIGFNLQLGRLEKASPGGHATQVYARRLAVLLAIGLVHAALLWSGDVLVVYAVLGFALLAMRRLPDAAVLVLIGLCLLYPALSDALRPLLLSFSTEAVGAFQYEEFEASNALAFGKGSFLDAVRETARIFVWGYTSPLGLFSYAAFYVQMATGILLGFLVGRHHWVERMPALREPMRRAGLGALGVALLAGACWLAAGGAGTEPGASNVPATLARTVGRAALMAFYALVVLQLLELPWAARLLRPFAFAGRMPLSNYLLQTLMGSFIFYAWGLGFWGRATPLVEVLLPIALFLAVQLPLSAWWLSRFRYGPVEYVWRRLTYGRLGD
ncbi:MAG: DUF418 domain-containing protein [Burkholderiales bacterium]|nr:DUF418 domain-containing protein [Burkholderiales bacterium]